jgi:antitoxin CptB
MSEESTIRKRRALWRAHHRGTKELDLIVGRYADAHLEAMEPAGLARFEAFLALPDPDLQCWLLGAEGPGEGEFRDIVANIRAFHGLKC